MAVDHDRTQADVAGGGFKAHGHIVEKLPDHQFFLDADHAVVRAGHARVRDVSRSIRQNALVGGGNVGVRANDGSDPPIEIPAQRNLLRGGLGVHIDQDDVGGSVFQEFVRHAKEIVVRGHEDAALQVDHGVGDAILAAFVEALSGQVGRIVGGVEQPWRRAVSVSVGHREKVDNFALVPDVIAGSDDINAEFEKLFGERRGDAKAGGRVYAISDDEVDGVILHQAWKLFLDDDAARPSKNVADKKYAQKKRPR